MRSLALTLAALLLAFPLKAGELLDQVVVTVNGNALLQSDWDAEVRYEALMGDRPLGAVTQQDRESALNRIIDQELLHEQMRGSDFTPAPDSEVDEQIRLMRSQFEHHHAGADWSDTLAKYGFSETDIRDHVQSELNQLRLVDERLRPSVEVDPAEIETYYKEKIEPQNSPSHTTSLDEARANIRELLVEQKINQLLDSWLESLRSQAQIHRVGAASAEGAEAK